MYFDDLHPFIQLILLLSIILLPMISMNPVILVIVFLSGCFYYIVRNGWKQWGKYLLATSPFVILSMIINPLFNHQGVTVLFYYRSNPITMESFVYGISTGIMMASVFCWFSILHQVITAEKVMYLSGSKFPHLAILFSMILRFVPRLKEQYLQIRKSLYGIQVTAEIGRAHV